MNAFKDTFKSGKEKIKKEVDVMTDNLSEEAKKLVRSTKFKLIGISYLAGILTMGIILLIGRCSG